MPIDFACPECSQRYRLKDSLAGKSAKCAKCGKRIQIPKLAPVADDPPLDPLESDLGDLLDDRIPVPIPPHSQPTPSAAVTTTCPGCGSPLASAAVLCVACGYDRKSGGQLTTERSTAKSKEGGSASFGKGAMFSFGGAMLGAGVWVGIALTTGYEIGWIAWGLGALAGIGMALGHEDDDGTLAGILAGAFSIVGIVAAKWMIFEQLTKQLTDLGITGDALAALEELTGESVGFSSMFGPIDGLFILLAVASAYQLGSGKATD